MDGIQIEITETSEINNNSSEREEKLSSLNNSKISNIEFDTDTFVAKQLDYQENYLIADLKKIADYYEIPTRKLRKDDIIQEIVIYESNPDNSETYLKRLQSWYWLKELKEDSKLKHFILF